MFEADAKPEAETEGQNFSLETISGLDTLSSLLDVPNTTLF